MIFRVVNFYYVADKERRHQRAFARCCCTDCGLRQRVSDAKSTSIVCSSSINSGNRVTRAILANDKRNEMYRHEPIARRKCRGVIKRTIADDFDSSDAPGKTPYTRFCAPCDDDAAGDRRCASLSAARDAEVP